MQKYQDNEDDQFGSSKLRLGKQDEESQDGSHKTPAEKWNDIDAALNKAIYDYHDLKTEINGQEQSTFLDLIIRLTLCRVYANNQSSKILTAEKLLGLAYGLIERLKKKGSPLDIADKAQQVQFLKDRQEAPIIPIEILEQKFYMHKGLLMISFNRDQNRDAKDSFIMALNIKPIYDIRIKKFCVEQL